MTDKEKLIAIISELESRIRSMEACFSGKFPMTQSVTMNLQDEGKLQAYKEVLEMLNSKEDSSLTDSQSINKSLEHAAEKYAAENFECADYHSGDFFDPLGFAEKSFIAGANWQKALMIKDAFDGIVDSRLASEDDDVLYYAVHYPINKQPFKCGDKVKMIIFKED